MYKYKIRLDTMSQLVNFVNIVSKLPGEMYLRDGVYCLSPKSILGARLCLGWRHLVLESSNDIYYHIQQFIPDGSSRNNME